MYFWIKLSTEEKKFEKNLTLVLDYSIKISSPALKSTECKEENVCIRGVAKISLLASDKYMFKKKIKLLTP